MTNILIDISNKEKKKRKEKKKHALFICYFHIKNETITTVKSTHLRQIIECVVMLHLGKQKMGLNISP